MLEDISETALLDAYYKKIYKLCLFYLRDRSEAEELLHDIFIKILKKKKSFKAQSHIYTWMYRVAVNTIINHLNRKKLAAFLSLNDDRNTSHPPEPVDKTADPAEKQEKESVRLHRLHLLETCIGTLSNREKTAFYFFHYDRLRQKEIATVMNTSVSAVEALLHKAMKKIKACVGAK